MKKPKGTVHPSPPNILSHHLTFLPVTILALAASLPPEEKEALAYLISYPSSAGANFSCGVGSRKPSTSTAHGGKNCNGQHPPMFNCNCFSCYRSYWHRWDSSPNRDLIDKIIDAFDQDYMLKQHKSSLTAQKNSRKDRKQRRKDLRDGAVAHQWTRAELESSKDKRKSAAEPEGKDGGEGDQKEQVSEKGSVKRFVSFLGEKIWSVLGQ